MFWLQGGAFSIDMVQFQTIFLSRNIFLHNIAFSQGGAFSINSFIGPIQMVNSDEEANLYVLRSHFIMNKAVFGGAFYSADFIRSDVKRNYFKFNKAVETATNSSKRSKGGAIYSKNSGAHFSDFINNHSIFIKNKADIGGALYFDSFNLIYHEQGPNDWLFQDNSAINYGSNLASSAVKVGFSQKFPEKTTKITEIQQNFSLIDVPCID